MGLAKPSNPLWISTLPEQKEQCSIRVPACVFWLLVPFCTTPTDPEVLQGSPQEQLLGRGLLSPRGIEVAFCSTVNQEEGLETTPGAVVTLLNSGGGGVY